MRKTAIATLFAGAASAGAHAQQAPALGNAAPLESVFTWDTKAGDGALPKAADIKPVEAKPVASNRTSFNCARLEAAEKPSYYQGGDGWFFRSSDRTEEIAFNPPILAQLKRLNDVLKGKGTTLIPLPLPTRVQFAGGQNGNLSPDIMPRAEILVEQDKRFRDDLATLGMATFPAPTAYDPSWAFRRDIHWTPEGARYFATSIAGVINTLPAIKDLPRKTFSTSPIGRTGPAGFLSDAVQAFCDETLPPEDMTLYRTEQGAATAADLFSDTAPDANAGADLLFGDAGTSPIALVGTSFSREKFHFDGFLMRETGLDVANHQINGGGPFWSMIGYLSALPAGKAPSPVLVWEFQRTPLFFIGAPLGFRMAIPAAKGICSGPNQLRTEPLTLGEGKSHSLPLAETEAMQGKDDYINLAFDVTTVRDVLVTFRFSDGQIEDVPVVLDVDVPKLERFFLELPADIDAPLASIDITTRHAAPVNATLQLCNGSPSTP